jgi:hypothetical protein
MTSRFNLCVIAAALALLLSPSLDAAPKKGGGPKLVPFKGRFTGTTLSNDTSTTDPDTGVTTTITDVTIEGGGNATHLGRFTLDGTASTTTTSDSSADDATSSLVFVAANGDEVWATFSGESDEDSHGLVESELTATIVGGTGRFATSTGYFTVVMTTDPDTGKSTGSFNGKISGPGKGN